MTTDIDTRRLATAVRRRMGLRARVVSRIQAIFDRLDFQVVRRGPVQRMTPILPSPDEQVALDRDLEAIHFDDQFEVFTSADAVRTYLSPARMSAQHHIIELCHKFGVELKGKKVLEVGAGTGYLLRLLAAEVGDGGKAYGAEYFQELAYIAQGVAPDAEVVKAALIDLPAAGDRYDVVFCIEVLEHIIDTETPIPTMLELLNPGGAVVITVPNVKFDNTPPLDTPDGNTYVGHVNCWTPQSWEYYINRIAGAHSFEVGTIGHNYEGDNLYAVIRRD